ncbi:MAG: hypothetical protein JW760_13335 [Spirochaetales bacterium]|nr:hypothetical protein [Spirochaetales bacterium]
MKGNHLLLGVVAAFVILVLLAGCPLPFDTEKLSVLQDSRPPEIVFTAPEGGSVFESAVSVSGTVIDYDNDGEERSGSSFITVASYFMQDDDEETTELTLAADGSFTFSVATASFTSQITIVVSATDRNGNTGTGSITLAPDTAGPFLAVTSPGNYSEYATAVTLSGYVRNSSSDTWITEVADEIVYEMPGTAISGTINLDSAGVFSKALDVSTLSGSRTIEVTAADLNGNVTTAVLTIVKPADGGDISNFSVTPGNRQVTISWDPAPYAESYTISELKYLGEDREDVTSPYVWENLENGTEYSFSLTAHMPSAYASDAMSAEVEAMPLSTRTLAPSIRKVGFGEITLEWDTFEAVSEHTVERSLSPEGPWKVRRKPKTGGFTDSGLSADTAYYYRVYPSSFPDIKSDYITATPDRFFSNSPGLIKTVTIDAAQGTAVSGNYVYAANGGSGISVIDISDPAAASVVASCDTGGTANSVFLDGDYAFVANGGSGLAVIDISNPLAPVLAANRDTTGDSTDITVSGNYAYLADGASGLAVIDISDPENPGEPAYCNTDGTAVGVAASGNYILLADDTGGLDVIDVSSPLAPAQVNGDDFGGVGRVRDVIVSGNYAFVAYTGFDNDLNIYDISDLSSPLTCLSYFTMASGEYAWALAASGRYVYILPNSPASIYVVDVSNPASPVLCETSSDSSSGYGITVSGGLIFAARGTTGVQIMNAYTPRRPWVEGTYDTDGSALGVAVAGNYAYVADGSNGLVICDVSDPASPAYAGRVGGALNDARGVAAAGKYAYVAGGLRGLVICDVSDPAAPKEKGSCSLSYSDCVAVSGSYAYVGHSSGVSVIDISDPAAPVLTGTWISDRSVYNIAVVGDYAYAANDYDYRGLRVIDISDPAAPVVTGTLSIGDAYARGVAADGTYAYLVNCNNDTDQDLIIADVTTPASPTAVGYADSYTGIFTAVGDAAVAGNLLIMASPGGGVAVVDVSDRSAPVFIGIVGGTGAAWDVAIAGSWAYAACEGAGLKVIRLRGE